MGSIVPHVKAGRLRGLGVTSVKRSPAVPDLPTLAEAGVSGFEVTVWSGLVVQAGVPLAIVKRLNAEVNTALAVPAVKEKLGGLGYDLVGGPPEHFEVFVRKEIKKWAEVVKRTGAKVE
jgi:tripartite-type tricarboxylate transporter receptor subunit TctC